VITTGRSAGNGCHWAGRAGEERHISKFGPVRGSDRQWDINEFSDMGVLYPAKPLT
jgi:hypothetical protein